MKMNGLLEHMGLKENLKNRIRGWLPKEPNLPSDKVKMNSEKKELQEFAYDVGRELGGEMGGGLEENWKRHVIAAVIAVSCGLLLILLNSVWYIVGLSTFILYGIAYYSLSKLSMKIRKGTKRK
jgi:hypothetical protein